MKIQTMKKTFLLALISAIFVMTSCGDPEPDVTTDPDTTTTPELDTKGLVSFDLSTEGLDYTMMVPNQESAKALPLLTYRDGTDDYLLQVGDKFQIVIVEDAPDMDFVKADLENALDFTNTIITEEADYIIYKTEAPDMEGEEFYHFYMFMNIGGYDYVFRDYRMEDDFNQMHVERMIKSIKTSKALMSA